MADRDAYEDGWPDEIDDSDEGFEFDCGLTASGQCLLAGTEECDWECPVMAEMIADALRRRSAAERRRRRRRASADLFDHTTTKAA